MFKIDRKFYYWFWILVFPLVLAGGAYGSTGTKAPVYAAKIIYTVLPKEALPKGSYEDLQASNLFIDVVKSWVESDNLLAEAATKVSQARLHQFLSLSMQTFAVTVAAPQGAEAIAGANLWREIIYREIAKYTAQAGENGGYVIYNFEPTTYRLASAAYANAALGGLLGLVLAGFVLLWDKYYRKR